MSPEFLTNAELSPELVSSIAGIVLSLALSYIPGLSDWFAGLSRQYKQATVGVLIVVTGAGIVGLSCTGILGFVECTQADATRVAWNVILALITSQGTHQLTKG